MSANPQLGLSSAQPFRCQLAASVCANFGASNATGVQHPGCLGMRFCGDADREQVQVPMPWIAIQQRGQGYPGACPSCEYISSHSSVEDVILGMPR